MKFFRQINNGVPTAINDVPRYDSIENQLKRLLNLLNGTKRWAFSLSPVPFGLDLAHAPQAKLLAAPYLRAAGTAHAMTLEYAHYEDSSRVREAVGRSTPELPTPTVPITFSLHRHIAFAEEVFTAEQALPIFMYFFRKQAVIPEEYHLRRLPAKSSQLA